MTAWMIMALLGLTVSLPMFDSDDVDEEDIPETPDTPDTPDVPETPVGETINGTSGDDALTAAAGETVNGLEGNDTLTSAAEGTTLNGGSGADEINLTAASGSVDAGEGADTIVVDGSQNPESPSTLNVDGGAGDDSITANGIGGTIQGGGAEDVINVQGTWDGVFGGAGDDVINSDTADFGGGTPLDGGIGNDRITLTESAGFNTQSVVNGGEGNDTIATQSVVGNAGVDVFDILSGGSGADVFEMSFFNTQSDPAAAGDLGNIVQITDFNAAEDRLIVDLSAFPVFAQQVDAPNRITFDVAERADGSGSDVTFNVANADANGRLSGSIALDGALGLVADDISLVFSGVTNPS